MANRAYCAVQDSAGEWIAVAVEFGTSEYWDGDRLATTTFAPRPTKAQALRYARDCKEAKELTVFHLKRASE